MHAFLATPVQCVELRIYFIVHSPHKAYKFHIYTNRIIKINYCLYKCYGIVFQISEFLYMMFWD